VNSLAALPSPTRAIWSIGPFPLRAYALCIIAGMVVACVTTDRRMRARGTVPWAVLDLAIWAIPLGIVGSRVYSLITSPEMYFGDGHGFWEWAQIWKGGLGVWGGVAGGAVGAWIGCRQRGLSLSFVGDALAVGLPLAQAIGRVGNWFNNELYGSATSLPWGLKVYQMDGGRAVIGPDGQPVPVEPLHPELRYHPTFLYEALWCVGIAVLVYLLDRRYKFGRGRLFAIYVMAYTVGRFWIEALRQDPANHFLGMRINDWISILVFLGALAFFLRRRGAVQERAVLVGEIARNQPGTYRMVDAPDGAEVETARARAEGEPDPAAESAAPADGPAPDSDPAVDEPEAEPADGVEADAPAGPDNSAGTGQDATGSTLDAPTGRK
jgi:prolipoprotein diacylglyceryl transferase